MAGTNRAARRRNERDQAKRIKSQGGAPSTPRPSGTDFGVEVDHADGFTYLTLHGGYMSTTVKWARQDVEHIVKMLLADEGEKAPEVVRQSGIVVAKDMP